MRGLYPLRHAADGQAGLHLVARVVLGVAILVAGSYVSLPMYPVPMTMQTWAVTMVGAVYGWRLGGFTVMVWLGLALAGAPVLAGGAGGAALFAGPTGGYLAAFPIVAALTGWLAERGCDGARPLLAFLAMLAGTGLCLLLGWLWLAGLIGAATAFTHGVAPFVLGGLVKSALGALALVGLRKLRRSA